MSTTTLQQIREWASRSRWRDGLDAIPGTDAFPTISQVEDWIRDFEMEAMETAPPKFLNTTGTVTMTSGDHSYGDITDMWDEQVTAAYITLTDGTTRLPLDVMDYSVLRKEFTTFGSTVAKGRPRFYAVNPANREIVFYPTPDAAYVATFDYIQTPPLRALPADPVWFWQGVSLAADDSVAITDSTFVKDFIDRPRKLTMTTATERTGSNTFTVTGEDEDGLTVSDTLTFSTGAAASTQTTSEYFSRVTSVTAGDSNPDTLSMNFGIAASFPSGTNYSTVSALPDEWALRLIDGAVSRYFEYIGEYEAAERFRAQYAESLKVFRRKYAASPMATIRFFTPGRYVTRNYLR